MASLNQLTAAVRSVADQLHSHIVVPPQAARNKAAQGQTPDLVTEVDQTSERLLFEQLAQLDKKAAFCSEESSPEIPDAERYFVIDPIDGTNNLVNGVGPIAINVAYVVEGQTQLGVTHLLRSNQTICSEAGKGVFCDGQRVEVGYRPLPMAMLALGVQPKHLLVPQNHPWYGFVSSVRSVRGMGSLAAEMAYVACGLVDVWAGLGQPWDVLPGLLHLQEAGAATVQATGYKGQFDSEGSLIGEIALPLYVSGHPKLITELQNRFAQLFE